MLENESNYQQWKKKKLECYNARDSHNIISVTQHADLSSQTMIKFALQFQAFNFAFFQIDNLEDEFSTRHLLDFGRQFGLRRVHAGSDANSEGVTLLSALDSSDKRSRYIPYTSRALNWHTDCYYNSLDSRIDAFLLYCVNQAGRGGENFFLDPEMIYMQIRDIDPKLLIALMDSNIMEVPENISDKEVVRPAESGPVFIVDGETGRLNMRFSARPQNISWKTNALSIRAVKLVRELLEDSEYVTRQALESRQGIICNNVLHGRSAFEDSGSDKTSRLYYRARFYDLVSFPADLR